MNHDAFRAGYDWALTALRDDVCTYEEIEANCDASGIDANDFDRGARAALRDYNNARQL